MADSMLTAHSAAILDAYARGLGVPESAIR
jgi:hypothetical protein